MNELIISELCKQGMWKEASQTEISLGDHYKGELGSVHTERMLEKFVTVVCDNIKDDVRLISAIQDPTLITGETGTGKELIARALHGSRKGKFIGINTTSLPDYLLESELFGHRKGAFTGAFEDKQGMFQAAKDGTIFLDEIGDMPEVLQAKLLRVLQENTVRRVGSNVEEPINCRFLFATNILDLSSSNKFRRDLLWRINSFIIHIPALIDRASDIEPILSSLLGGNVNPIPEELLKYVIQSPLQGNVRELQTIVRRWKVLKRI